MPGPRQFTQVDERRQVIAQRYLRGEMQSAIAKSLGVTQQLISHDLKAIRAKWLQSALRDFDAAKAQELAKIDAVEAAAWSSFEKSLQAREITVTEATEGEGAPKRKASVRKEGQAGDVRFLDIVLKCIAQRCDILGLLTSAEALKELSGGLASLLTQARTTVSGAPSLPPPAAGIAEA